MGASDHKYFTWKSQSAPILLLLYILAASSFSQSSCCCCSKIIVVGLPLRPVSSLIMIDLFGATKDLPAQYNLPLRHRTGGKGERSVVLNSHFTVEENKVK